MRTKALSWGFVRVSVGYWVLVLWGRDGFCKRVENSLRGKRFGDLNSSGFILLRCIIIETTRRKVEGWTLEPPLLILFREFKVSAWVET